jgi:hypothetical protein
MMRAMRQNLASCAFACALLLVAGCGDDTAGGGPDMSMPADLTVGPDIAVRMPDGVACGTATCPTGQSCCVMASGTSTTGATCIAAGGNCTGGAVLACDGPEDCSSSMQFCCGTIKLTGSLTGDADAGAPMFNGGNASCAATCDASFTPGSGSTPTTVKTRLCKIDDDCTGLSIGGVVGLNKCCSSTQAPGLHFCAAALGAGITCP